MSDFGLDQSPISDRGEAYSRLGGLPDLNGGSRQKRTLTSTMLNDVRWSRAAIAHDKQMVATGTYAPESCRTALHPISDIQVSYQKPPCLSSRPEPPMHLIEMRFPPREKRQKVREVAFRVLEPPMSVLPALVACLRERAGRQPARWSLLGPNSTPLSAAAVAARAGLAQVGILAFPKAKYSRLGTAQKRPLASLGCGWVS